MTEPTPLKTANLIPVEDVIRQCEKALADAKAGRLRDVAIVGTTSDNSTLTRTSYRDNLVMIGMLQVLTHEILEAAFSSTRSVD